MRGRGIDTPRLQKFFVDINMAKCVSDNGGPFDGLGEEKMLSASSGDRTRDLRVISTTL